MQGTQKNELVFIQAQLEMKVDQDSDRGDREMDTAPNHATTAAPRKTERNPPAMETTKQGRPMDKAKPDNGKEQLQQPMNPKKENNQLKKEVMRSGSWNIRRGVWKQEIEVNNNV